MRFRFCGGGADDGGNDAVLRGGDHARRQQRLHFGQLIQLALLGAEQGLVGAAEGNVGQIADPVVLPLFGVCFQIDGLNVAFFAGCEVIGHMDMARGGAQLLFFIEDGHFAAFGAVGVGEGDGGYAVRNIRHVAVRIGAARLDLHRGVDGQALGRSDLSRHQPVQRQKRDAALLGHHILQVMALLDVDFLHPAVHGHFHIGVGGVAVAQGGQLADGGVQLFLQGVDGGLQGRRIDGQQRLTGCDGIALFRQRFGDGDAVVQRHVFRLTNGQRAGSGHGFAQIAPGNGIRRHQRSRAAVLRLRDIFLIGLPAEIACRAQNAQRQ